MQLFFRVEGNEHIGLGHLMRCFALSQAAQHAQVDVVFICSQTSKRFLLSRHKWHGEIVVIDDNHLNNSVAVDVTNERNKAEVEFIATCMSRYGSKESSQYCQILVLDGYQFDHSYQQAIAATGICFAYLDDINTFLEKNQHHIADVVINGAAAAQQLDYLKNAQNSRLCLGPQYLLLRPEFIDLPLIPIADRHSLLICFGGGDAQNHTLGMLGALSQLNFQFPVTVITGAAYKWQKQLTENIQDGWLNYNNAKHKISMPIHYIHDVQEMAEVMLHSRLSISAAGGTQFELMRCYTPSYLVVVADNQMPAATESSQQGWCNAADWRQEVDYIGLAKQVTADYSDTESLIVKQNKAYDCVQKEASSGADNLLNVFSEVLNLRR
nr:UDP-2,4-diacetamido-2,4,6-trideoxy-beta-L-altropyranose hydrolase [uncultured Glaciecola sp.]